MKLKIEKQSLLKGLLFAALVANLSWHPAMKSLNLSSETAPGVPAPPAPQANAATLPKSPNAIAPSADGPRPDAPARPAVATAAPTSDKAPRVEAPKICGQRFYISYNEIVVGSEVMTEVNIKPYTGVINNFRPITYRAAGGFELNLDNKEIKKDNDEKIKGLVRARIGRCADDVEIIPVNPPESKISKEDEKLDKAALAKAVKECRKDRKGDVLTEIQRTRCQIQRLSEIDIDPDKRGSSSRVMAEIERLLKGDIRKSIKNRLMSKDDSKIEEGEDLLSEVIDATKDLTSQYNLDPSRMSRLVTGLESLRAGGETYRRSTAMDEEVRTTKAEMREELLAAQADLRMNPRDPFAQQRYLQVQRDIMNREVQLQNQMRMDIVNGPYQSLVASMRMGAMSSSEFSQFTQPYQVLNRDLLSMLDPRSLVSSGPSYNPSIGALGTNMEPLPNDFMSYRMGLANNFQRNYGLNVPQRPSTLGSSLTPNWTNSLNNNSSTFNNLYAPPNNVGGRRWQ